MSLFNNKLSKVPLGMLDTDVQNKFTGYDTSLAEKVSQVNGVKPDVNGNVTITTSVGSADWSTITSKPVFSTVATSGSYNDLTNQPSIPSAYSLPTASSTVLGGVKIGTGVSVDANGVISVSGGGGSSSSANVYEIELARWGIVQGLPTKPYQTSDYTKANNNMQGINNALAWANSQGYNYVVLPRGQYSVCYPLTIETQPNMLIDFNFSTLKVMYDSVNRSPFDTSSNPVYQFGGNVIQCTTPNTTISNLTLIGDRIERSWIDPNEVNQEVSTGITFGSGAYFSKVSNCNVSYFMADAIGMGYGPYTSFNFSAPMEAGSLSSTGQPVTGTTNVSVRTQNYTTIPNGINGFCMIGLGFAPGTSIPSGQYNVYFYDSTNTFLWSYSLVRTRDFVTIPKNAVYLKLSWEGYIDSGTGNVSLDGNGATANPPYWAVLVENGIGDHITIQDCELHANNRGAMTVGVNNVLVKRTYFHDTGEDASNDENGIPNFPDGTRYGINTEDNSGHNCRFINNVFSNIRLAIAIRGEYNEISGNEFRHCGYGAYLYSLNHCVVSNNYFYYAPLGCYDYTNLDRHWHVYGNTFRGSGFSWGGTGTISAVNNNTFYNSTSTIGMHILNFTGNTFDNSTINWGSDTLTISEKNSFNNNSIVTTPNTIYPFEGVRRCTFKNGSRINTSSNGGNLLLKDCDFNDGGLKYNDQTIYTLQNCRVNNSTQRLMYDSNYSDIGQTHNTLQLLNCSVIMGQVALIGSMHWGSLIIDGSTLTWNLTSNLGSALQDTYGLITDAIKITNTTITANGGTASQSGSGSWFGTYYPIVIKLDGNTFTNFSLTNVTTEIQSSHMSAAPTVGTFTLGQQVFNSNPIAGGYLGWICMTAGNANNTSWTSGTSYNANVTFVNTSGNVYQCTTKGASTSTVQPTGTTTTGVLADGYVWKYINPLAVFKQYGAIQA